MFSRLVKKEKLRVYLNSLTVVPREGFKTMDEWWLLGREDFDSVLRQKLLEIFSLPHVSSIDDPRDTDLAIDVVVPDYRVGFEGEIIAWGFLIPLMWRPRVEIRSRLFNIQTGKTLQVFSAVQKIPWRDFFSRAFSLRGLFRITPLFTPDELEYLLLLASESLLRQMRKKI